VRRASWLAAALLAAAGSASAAIQTVTIGEMYDGGTVNLAPGDTLEIHPGACPADCVWAQAFGDAAIVKPAGDPPTAGAPVFRFRALTTGSSSLGLACRKPSDPKAPPGGLFRVLVVVKESILPRGLLLEEPDNASTVFLTQGDVLQVRLPSNPTTGYAWSIASNAPSVLQPQGDPKYEPASKPTPGAAGTQTFGFRVVGGGPVFLELVYRRPFEKDTPPARQWGVFLCAASLSATAP
jgi:inhibitor of cysteine peptidase